MADRKGNVMYIVCEKHEHPADALPVASREGARYTSPARLGLQADAWWAKHRKCGHGDHYKLAYAQKRNWDAETDAAHGVRAALDGGALPVG